MRRAALILPAILTAVLPAYSLQSSLPDSPAARFAAAAPEVHEYRAWRRLEAESPRFGLAGWIEVVTTLGPTGFTYEVVGEGGSERIRRSVLRAALDAERELVADAAAALTGDNYVFADDGAQDGLARIRVTPRRRSKALLDGYLLVTPRDSDLVELHGQLVKTPSFWVSRVDMVRRYARILGVRLPVLTESVARVRLAGRSTFAMRYVYTSVDGRPVPR